MIDIVNEYLNILIDGILVNGYGWMLFVWVLVWLFYKLRLIDNQKKFMKTVKWVFLEVKIEEASERSALAMEQIFAALHAIHVNITWGEKFDGKQVLWLSCEIVSIGGRVSYIFRIPERYRNLLESAIFAQYPKAEITEVEDYLKNLPKHYDPETAEFDFWGTQMNKKKESAYPIKIYSVFEHPGQETVVDPLAGVIEVMSNIGPDELMAAQIVIKPVDDSWKVKGQKLVDKLKGAPEKKHSDWFLKIFLEFPGMIIDALFKAFVPSGEEKRPSVTKDEPPSQMLHKTEGEKTVIAAIERGLSKIGYEVKFRILYLAPKGKLNKSLRVPEIIGAYRNFDDVSLNGPKPDVNRTWTDATYKVSRILERPLIKFKVLKKKRHFWFNFKDRSAWRGTGHTILNTEELASVYHFPQAPNVRVSQVERVGAVKSAPPQDLPIG